MPTEKITRDYKAISPSARSLLLLKGITSIPFARQAAELLSLPAEYRPDTDNTDLAFWKRVVHFESRYWSVDQLVEETPITNILEISSGFSFRGLDTISKRDVQYIDTDLAEVITEKKELLSALEELVEHKVGNLQTLPLNAFDENAFMEAISLFPKGPVLIVNEGLMMYLSNDEKAALSQTITKVLALRGGYWITGDIYVKSTLERLQDGQDDSLKELVDQQQIENNMFDSFDTAASFFAKQGLVIEKEAVPDFSKLSSLPYLMKNSTPAQLKEMRAAPKKIQATWKFKLR